MGVVYADSYGQTQGIYKGPWAERKRVNNCFRIDAASARGRGKPHAVKGRGLSVVMVV